MKLDMVYMAGSTTAEREFPSYDPGLKDCIATTVVSESSRVAWMCPPGERPWHGGDDEEQSITLSRRPSEEEARYSSIRISVEVVIRVSATTPCRGSEGRF